MTRSSEHPSPRTWKPIVVGLYVIVAAALFQPARATDVCGAVCDQTWTAAESPYVATCDVTVATACALTIESGVEVRFHAGRALVVEGTLDVNGSSGSTVTFTSDEATPAPGDWRGLELVGSSTGSLDYVTVHYADQGIHVNDDASVTLTDVASEWNNNGLRVEGAGPPSVQASGCRFTGNDVYGVHVTMDALGIEVTITRSEIHSNGHPDRDFVADSPLGWSNEEVLHARENWWGTTDTRTIGERIEDATEGNGNPAVDWCAYLESPGGAPRDVHCPNLTVLGTETLSLTDKPYLVTSDLHVGWNSTLIIEAGVDMRFADQPSRAELQVLGDLQINGTEAAPVTLRSDAAAPMILWEGVDVHMGTATIRHAEIQQVDIGIYVHHGGAVTLEDVAIHDSTIGVRVGADKSQGLQTTLSANNCRITNSEQWGIIVFRAAAPHLSPAVTIVDSEIHSNVTGNIKSWTDDTGDLPQFVIDARRNWWGATDTAEIALRIEDDLDNDLGGRVDWCGYLDGPEGSSVVEAHCTDLVVCDEIVVWDQTDLPYVLTSDVTVCPTGGLTIGAGVEIRAAVTDPPLALIVEGTLDVNGTGLYPVRFTAGSGTPSPGDWSGLRLRSASTSTIDHAEVSYAERGVHIFESASAALNGVTSRRNQDGLHLYGHLTVDVVNSAFIDNDRYGVYAQGVPTHTDPTVHIHDSALYANGGGYDVYLDGGFSTPASTAIEASGNWWGTTSTGQIASRIHDRVDSATNATVDWCPHATGPDGTPAPVACFDRDICNQTEILDETHEPYLVTSSVYVCPTGTLRIEPGVELRMVTDSTPIRFLVEGTLDVNGTSGSPVLFTSDADLPAAGDWSGLRFEGALASTLTHATVEYGVFGIYTDNANTITLDNVSLTSNWDGIHARSTDGRPTIHAENCRITNNTQYGINLYEAIYHAFPLVTIHRSEIHSNLGSLDYFTSKFSVAYRKVLDARENWWGSADPGVFGPRVMDHRKENQRAMIDFCRYLDGPGGEPVVDAHCPDLAVCDETVTLDLTDKPYQVTSDLYVCDTGALEVDPGVTVLVAAGSPLSDIQIHGTLDVRGTEGSPVVFASDAPSPQPVDWTGLYLSSFAAGSIDHAEISHAARGIHATGGSTVTVTDVRSFQNFDGVYAYGWDPPTVTIERSELIDNDRYGVYAARYTGRANPQVAVSRSSIHSNRADYDFYFYPAAYPTRTVVDARDNWWGTTDPAAIGPRIYDHRTRDNGPIVDWCGYLDGPDGGPARNVHCPDLAPCDEVVVLDRTDAPYLLTSDLIVCDTGTLQIEAGVEVRTVVTTREPDFEVMGVLDVNGTPASPVSLTSDSSAPQVGDWYGVVLTESSNSTVDHAEISWASRGIEVNENATAVLEGVRLQRNFDGLFVQGYGGQTVTASGCSFTDNNRYGIFTRGIPGYPNPDVAVTRSAIHSNSGSWDFYAYDFATPDSAIVWATDNWWGTMDEEEIKSRIYDHDINEYAPRVYHRAFGEECDWALGGDSDRDGLPDFGDNCPDLRNGLQADTDADGMGDACDPEPATAPSGACDGFGDVSDGYVDADGDGWGDPCDHQPLRDDSYPGAPELCDARDNDGDGAIGAGERADEDFDLGIVCGDCDDLEPLANVCACEACDNLIDDDCDLATDGDDADCVPYPSCVVLTASGEPWLELHKGECGGAGLSGPYDVIRGELGQVWIDAGHVDLGEVECVEGGLDWDRVTDYSLNPNPRCDTLLALYFLGKNSADPDYGAASGGERRDVTNPDPVCP